MKVSASETQMEASSDWNRVPHVVCGAKTCTALSDPRFTAKASSWGFEVPSGRPSGLYASERSHSEADLNIDFSNSPACGHHERVRYM